MVGKLAPCTASLPPVNDLNEHYVDFSIETGILQGSITQLDTRTALSFEHSSRVSSLGLLSDCTLVLSVIQTLNSAT